MTAARPAFWPWPARYWWAIWIDGPSVQGRWRGPYKLTRSEADNWEVDVREAFINVAVEVTRYLWTGVAWVRG